MASYSEQIAEYQRLRREGYSGPQASEMVWGPGGIQNLQKQRQKEAGRAGQAAAVGQVAGTVGGYYGATKGYDYLFPGKEKALADAATKTAPAVLPGANTPTVPSTTPVTTPPASTMEGMFTATPQNNLYTPGSNGARGFHSRKCSERCNWRHEFGGY